MKKCLILLGRVYLTIALLCVWVVPTILIDYYFANTLYTIMVFVFTLPIPVVCIVTLGLKWLKEWSEGDEV